LFIRKMNRILDLESKYDNVALMCSEKHPKDCHRAYKLSHWIHSETDFRVQHILSDGSLVDGVLFENDQPDGWVLKGPY